MFTTLTEKIEKVFKQLRGQAVLTEENITDALKEVRLALLEADVNFKIVKDFIENVRVKAVGLEVLKSLTPAHQVVKVVWEELRDLLGHEQSALHLSSQPPTIIMMVGLQGSGKTTTTGKLANYFKNDIENELHGNHDSRSNSCYLKNRIPTHHNQPLQYYLMVY